MTFFFLAWWKIYEVMIWTQKKWYHLFFTVLKPSKNIKSPFGCVIFKQNWNLPRVSNTRYISLILFVSICFIQKICQSLFNCQNANSACNCWLLHTVKTTCKILNIAFSTIWFPGSSPKVVWNTWMLRICLNEMAFFCHCFRRQIFSG